VTVIPDVTGEDEVLCPCGRYSCSTGLFAEVDWPLRQVACPNCGRVLEPLESGGSQDGAR